MVPQVWRIIQYNLLRVNFGQIITFML